jgi:hypothetical protein
MSKINSSQFGGEQELREIIKHISDAALELAFVRHGLTSDEVDVDDDAPSKERVEAGEAYCQEIKEDTFACLVGDDTGCLDPEELNASNCELLWLREHLTRSQPNQPNDRFCYAEGDEGAKYCGSPKSMHCSVLGDAVTHEHLVQCMRDDHFIHHVFVSSPAAVPLPAEIEADLRALAQRIVIESSIASGYADSTWLDGAFKHNLTERITAELAAQLTGSDQSSKALLRLERAMRDSAEREIEELTTAQTSCWHCGVLLEEAPRPRCVDCPDECDEENCDAMGCRALLPADQEQNADQGEKSEDEGN